MTLKRIAGLVSLLGAIIALVMGLVALANQYVYGQLNPGAAPSEQGAFAGVVAAVAGVAGWRLLSRNHRTGGLLLLAAAITQAAFVQPPVAAPVLALGGVLAIIASRIPKPGGDTPST